MAEAVLGKWGKNLALRLPANVARAARLEIGERVEVDLRDSEIIIRRRAPRFSAAELFKGKSAKSWRAAYAGAFDLGRRGRVRGSGGVSAQYVPAAGDLIWTDFDPTRGREQAGRRPALVISSGVFARNTGLAVVCPITSRVRRFPTSVVLPGGLPIAGEILTSNARSIDTLGRRIRYAGATVPLDVAQMVRAKLDAFITIGEPP